MEEPTTDTEPCRTLPTGSRHQMGETEDDDGGLGVWQGLGFVWTSSPEVLGLHGDRCMLRTDLVTGPSAFLFADAPAPTHPAAPGCSPR